MVYSSLIIFISSFLLSIIVLRILLIIFAKAGHFNRNYQGKDIPTSMGLVFIAPLAVVLTCSYFTDKISISPVDMESFYRISISFVVLIATFLLLGLADDIWGDEKTRGFRGHFSQLLEGRITTGLIKAIAGVFICFCVASYLVDTWTFGIVIIDALVLALAINLFNLFDVRPGRAIKIFLLVIFVLLIASLGSGFWLPALAMIASMIVVLPSDLRGKTMLGDAGSNVIGAIIGLGILVSFGIFFKLAVLVVFIALNILSELYSFSEVFKRNTVLNWFDHLGRSGNTDSKM